MDSNKVKGIFDHISEKYDRTNFVISLGLEAYWRKKFRTFIKPHYKKILDACCGTGRSTFSIWVSTNKLSTIYGIDLSKKMLDIARIKYLPYLENLFFKPMDASNLDFDNNFFDAVTIVFGIRNITNRKKALKEFYRVAKNGGKIICMEFGTPEKGLLSFFYNIYLKYILVNLGTLLTRKRSAYKYLVKTIKNFPSPEKFAGLMAECGWEDIEIHEMNFGICNIFIGYKAK